MYKDRYTKAQLERMDIARELLANRYLLNALLSSLYRVQLQFDHNFSIIYNSLKEKGLIREEEKKKVIQKRTRKREITKEKIELTEGTIEFEKFSLTGRQYNALVKEYGSDVVNEACILLDGYLKQRLKKPKDCYKKLKDWAIHLVLKDRLVNVRKDLSVINREVDYKTIEDKPTALKYIASVPSHIRNIDPGVKYLVEKFEIKEE